MTIEQRDEQIERIKRDKNLRLPEKAKQISAVLAEFQAADNPDPVYFNGAGRTATRQEWGAMSEEQRTAFRSELFARSGENSEHMIPPSMVSESSIM